MFSKKINPARLPDVYPLRLTTMLPDWAPVGMVTVIKLLDPNEKDAVVPPTVTVIPVEAKLLPLTVMVLPAI